MTPDVITTHQDGGLGNSDFIADRVHAKIGHAEAGTANQVYLIRNFAQALNIFIAGALLDSIRQHFEEFDDVQGQRPAPLLAIRPTNDTAGSIANPVKSEDSTGLAALPTTAGTPTGSRTVILRFTKAGAHATAEYRRSTDGGQTFEAPIVTPASGQPISLAVGVTATFTNDATPADTFHVGDEYTFVISGPTASNSARLDAIEALMQEYRLYWIHIIGPATRAFAVSVSQVLETMETANHLPCFAILESALKGEESLETYFQEKIVDEWDPFAHPRVGIVTAEGRYIQGGIRNYGGFSAVYDAGDTIGQWRNAATLLCAKLAAGAPNVSAGYVKLHRSLTLSEIRYWDEGYQDYMDVMHDMGLTVLKKYDDYDGIYIAKDLLKSPNGSDFRNIPERRRADKMHRIAYRESLPFLNMDTEVKSGSGGIDYIKATMDQKISNEMESPGAAEISGHAIKLDPEKTFSQTGILDADLVMFIRGRVEGIRWRTSFAKAS
ncbi:MAG: hypothetical protein HS115_11755 [Spirochaetales bacterium]|nr:hypothetical protein [Spirochaetales bacterium]